MAHHKFKCLQATLGTLGLVEAKHKASPPLLSQCMVLLGLVFNSLTMTITIPQPKIDDIAQMVAAWSTKSTATLHQLRVLLGKLLLIS